MNVNDYLIDQGGKDWLELLSGWSALLPASFTLWLVNRFGDVFLIVDDGSVHMLDVGAGTLARVADNRDHFAALIDADDRADGWLMIPLVDRCVSARMTLAENQCYSYKIPPMIGGEYTVDNAYVADIPNHYSFLTEIFRQTKDLSEGTRIRIVVTR